MIQTRTWLLSLVLLGACSSAESPPAVAPEPTVVPRSVRVRMTLPKRGQVRQDEFQRVLLEAKTLDASQHFALSGSRVEPDSHQLLMGLHVLFCRILDLPADRPLYPKPLLVQLFGSREEWDHYVEQHYPKENWHYAKTEVSGEDSDKPEPHIAIKAGGNGREWIEDTLVHLAAHSLLSSQFKKGQEAPLWLKEGLAYVFQFYLLGTVDTSCVPAAPPMEELDWNNRPPELWTGLLRDSVASGKSPDIGRVLGANVESVTAAERIKIFSLVDYFLDQKRAALVDFVRRLQQGEEHDRALLAAFGVESLEQLDRDWQAYVLRAD